MFSEDNLWGEIQRLMLQGCDVSEIAQKLSKDESEVKRHMDFLRNSVDRELQKKCNEGLNYNKEIADVFERVSYLDGVKQYGHKEVVIQGKYVNDYLLIGLLHRLIKDGLVDIKISENISDIDLDYLQRLLHLKKREINATK